MTTPDEMKMWTLANKHKIAQGILNCSKCKGLCSTHWSILDRALIEANEKLAAKDALLDEAVKALGKALENLRYYEFCKSNSEMPLNIDRNECLMCGSWKSIGHRTDCVIKIRMDDLRQIIAKLRAGRKP